MTRNEVKEMILAVINDDSISELDKNEQVLLLFREAEKEVGFRKVHKLAKQIEKESGFDMSTATLDKYLDR